MFSGRRVLTALLLTLTLGIAAAPAPPAPKPLSKADVIDLLKGQVPPERVDALARERGIDFRVTSEVESELRRAGATDELMATFRSLAPKQAGVQIEVTPGNAEVYVDDERVGKTSPEGRLKVTTLSPGEHRVRISLDGYRDFESTVQVKRGEVASVFTQLQSSGSSTPTGGQNTGSPTRSPGGDLMARVIEGLGGREKVRSVRSFRTRAKLTLYLPQGQLSGDAESVGDFSGRMWQKLSTPIGVFSTVATSASAFTILPTGIQEMSPLQKKDMFDDLWRNGYYVGQHADDPSFTFTPARDASVGGIQMKVLEIRGAGAETRWFIDPKTGWVMRAVWIEMGTGSPVEVQEDFENWQVVSGYHVPLKSTRLQNGQMFAVGVLTELEVNPSIDPGLFSQ